MFKKMISQIVGFLAKRQVKNVVKLDGDGGMSLEYANQKWFVDEKGRLTYKPVWWEMRHFDFAHPSDFSVRVARRAMKLAASNLK